MTETPLRKVDRSDGYVVELWLMLFDQLRVTIYHVDQYPFIAAIT